MNGLGLYWTDDGGARWRMITPPDVSSMGDAVARIGDIVYANPKHVWLVAEDIRGSESIAAAPRHSALERSTDGGRTWRSVRLPGCAGCAGVHLSVLRSAGRGFAIASTQRRSRLYATDDDAATWKLVADVPVAGPLVFTSRSNGWADARGGRALYRTVDGGRTWQRVKLEPPAAFAGAPMTLGVPRAFGSRRGLVPARFRARGAKAQHVVVFVTEDGGESWVARPTPASANVGAQTWGFPEALPFSAASPTDWILFVGSALYVTHDAGRTWSVFHPRNVPRAPLVWDVGFVSPSSGWAVFGYRRSTSPRLVETEDGGMTWRPLTVVLR
jgi:photosystem II stability/assembly factor-like uncharacterized protein